MNNLPNRLTILRMVLVPAVMFFMLVSFPGENSSKLIAALIFILASVTDWLDGYLARKHNLVSNFGKVMDPLADKLLVTAVVICLVQQGVFPVWCAMIIFARDFLVTGMRVVAVAENISVAANMWGKVKTVIQMVAMVVAILFGTSEIVWLNMAAAVAVYTATVATLISGIKYVYDYRTIFK